VARRAVDGFGMRVVYFNRSRIDPPTGATPATSIDEVLGLSDFVSLHVPGGESNRHLIDARRLTLMKPHAHLVNTARGEIVDEAALAEALARGRLAGAGLDVYEEEPQVHPGLLAVENVVLLPHLGSATAETRLAMGLRVIDNLRAFFDGQSPPDRMT
jgi:lactate dehydrogenase-like 2-hydroxyacid dehydrogenase